MSSVAKELDATTAQRYFREMPVYAHWLALEMLRVYESAKKKLGNNTELEFNIQHQKFVVDTSLLTEASEAIHTACKMEATRESSVVLGHGVLADANLFNSELAFTAITVCHLDRYLFSGKDSKAGFCLHQGPTRKRTKQRGCPEAADIYVCGNEDRCYGTPVAIGDAKLNKIQEAILETALYCCTSCLAQSCVPHQSPVYIGLPCTVSKLILYLYIASDSSDGGSCMWGIPIAEDAPYSKAILCALYCGIHFLLRETFYLNQPIQTPIPLNKTKLQLLTKGEKPRVFLDEGSQLVYKYFTDSFELPNQDLLKSVGGFEEVEVEKVAENLSILRYKYMRGNHEAQEVRQFRGVIQTLAKLHNSGYVHSDVRTQNILFHDNDSILIDYDLVANVGTAYPKGYRYFSERHDDAGPGRKRMKSHDIHSLLYLMCKCSTGKLEASLRGMMNSLDLIAEKETRQAAENESEEVKKTSLATLEERLARVLKEVLQELGRDGSEHGKNRRKLGGDGSEHGKNRRGQKRN